MTPTNLYKAYKDLFPLGPVESYIGVKNSNNTIRLKLKSGGEAIFTYEGPGQWVLRSIKKGVNNGI